MNRRTILTAGFLFFTALPLGAEGILPPPKTSPSANPAAPQTLLIGDRVTDAVLVTDLQGASRTLVSYKDPLDVMVVGFFSARCPEDQKERSAFGHFYDDYRTWGVTFIAVDGNSTESPADLIAALKKEHVPAGNAGLGVPVLRDAQGALARGFGIEKTPSIVIIDEGRALRYRGPLGKTARQAIDAVISHQEPVDQAEPPVADGCPIQ